MQVCEDSNGSFPTIEQIQLVATITTRIASAQFAPPVPNSLPTEIYQNDDLSRN
jgi:hypothetical protein